MARRRAETPIVLGLFNGLTPVTIAPPHQSQARPLIQTPDVKVSCVAPSPCCPDVKEGTARGGAATFTGNAVEPRFVMVKRFVEHLGRLDPEMKGFR
jgi:hypothetical protein